MMAQSESPGIRLHLQGGWLLGHRLRPQLLPRREAIEEMGASGIPAAFTPTAFAPWARHGSHQPTAAAEAQANPTPSRAHRGPAARPGDREGLG